MQTIDNLDILRATERYSSALLSALSDAGGLGVNPIDRRPGTMLRLTIYTDCPMLALGFRAVADSDPTLACPDFPSSLEAAIDYASGDESDILLVDCPSGITFAALRKLTEAVGNRKILLWTNKISTELAFQALGLGVRGILCKTLSPASVLECLHRVHEGELWFGGALTEQLMSGRRIALTRRQGQIVGLISQGLRNKEIAAQLMISLGTVKVYISKLYEHVGVSNRLDLAIHGLRNLGGRAGLVDGTIEAGAAYPADGMLLPSLRSLYIQAGPLNHRNGERAKTLL